jgi:PAS domain S-box-containing protein
MTTNLDFAALVNAVGDAVVACDIAGAIVLWNPGAERMFGFSQAEAIGNSLDIIIPERLKARHWEGLPQDDGNRPHALWERCAEGAGGE